MSTALQTKPGIGVEAVGGFLVDEDGEVVGVVEQPQLFSIDTTEAADWLLAKIAREESLIGAIEMRRKALQANLDRMRREHERNIAYLKYRFGAQVEAFARRELEGRRGRTLALDHGSLSFRRTPGRNEIVDPEAAVAWAESNAPDIVRIKKSVTATDAAKAWDGAGDPEVRSPRWMVRTEPGENFTIKTGVEQGDDR